VCLKMGLTFYREVRRLAFLRLICDIISKQKSSEIFLVSQKFFGEAKKLNEQLPLYKRNTGKVKSISVARNHFVVANALNLVKMEGAFVESTSEAAFFASLSKNNDNPFILTTEEKISFFDLLLSKRYQILSRILILLEASHPISFKELREKLRENYKKSHVDHVVKSHVEWLIDLDLIDSTSPRKGKFKLTEKGKPVKQVLASKISDNFSLISLKTYAETFLGGKIEIGDKIKDEILMSSFNKAIERTKNLAASEVSKELLSALPVIKSLRLVLLVDYRILLSMDHLIKIMKEILQKKGIDFKWDPMYKGGYIKI
jgi:hypothetical protein